VKVSGACQRGFQLTGVISAAVGCGCLIPHTLANAELLIRRLDI